MALRLVAVGKTALLVTVYPSGDRDEDAILEPVRRHIQIRKAEGADDEDIIREIWKWWTNDGRRVRGREEPKEIVAIDPFRGPGGTWGARSVQIG